MIEHGEKGIGTHAADKRVEWFGRIIFLEEEYLVYFSDQKRTMTDKQLQDYMGARRLPQKMAFRALAEMDPRSNPNVTPMKGWELIRLGEMGYVPQFDKFFDVENDPVIQNTGTFLDGKLTVEKPKSTRRLTLISPDGLQFFWDQAMKRARKK